MIHEHVLGGCTPTPLAHYLKALGILRLVAEQKDSDAAGRWQGEQFVLRTVLSQEELERFFLEEYQPSPIISPWNGRAGFLEGEDAENSNRTGAVLLKEFRDSTANRLQPYTRLIQELDKTESIKEMNAVRAKKKELDKTKKKDRKAWTDENQKLLADLTAREAFLKENLFAYLRNTLDEDQLDWLDGTVALGEDKAFAPLLGSSGGVEGSMDLGVNFMGNLKMLFSINTGEATELSDNWLKNCLYQAISLIKLDNTSGSLLPGNIGGPNATTGFTTKKSCINPWDYILMIEGALVLRPSMTRKMESSNNSNLSYPFTIEPSATGDASIALVDEKKARSGKSELWMPMWPAFAGFQEVSACFKEGSITLNQRKARTGLDFARSICQYGSDRGIDQFQRFIFLKRSGDNDVAVPLGRFVVNRNPQADLITHLDGWLERLRSFSRKDTAPGRIRQLVRRLEDEIFSLTRHGGALTLQNILTIIGQIQLVSAESPKTRDVVAPVPVLGTEWALEADDGSNEFRIAAALAGLDDMRGYILPLAANAKSKRTEWATSSALAVWGGGNLVTNLLRVLERRLLEMQRNQQEDKPFSGSPAADIASVMAFLHNETDDLRLAGLLTGLVNVNLPKQLPERNLKKQQPPAAFNMLKPLFTSDRILHRIGLLPETMHLPLSVEIVPLLKTGNPEQAEKALAIAWRRLRSSGVKLPPHPRKAPELVGIDSARLAASLMIPLATSELAGICKSFASNQENN